MSEKKKAAQVLQHQDGGEQTRLDGFDELPVNDFITAFAPEQGSIAALLTRDQSSALTAGELARLTGLTQRGVTKRICRERRDGAPILSAPGAGFWLASSVEELHCCVAALKRRANEIHKTACALMKEGETN